MVLRIFHLRSDVNVRDCKRGCRDTVKDSALKSDSGRNIPCRIGESSLRRRRAGPMLFQLSYIPISKPLTCDFFFQQPTLFSLRCLTKSFLITKSTTVRMQLENFNGLLRVPPPSAPLQPAMAVGSEMEADVTRGLGTHTHTHTHTHRVITGQPNPID